MVRTSDNATSGSSKRSCSWAIWKSSRTCSDSSEFKYEPYLWSYQTMVNTRSGMLERCQSMLWPHCTCLCSFGHMTLRYPSGPCPGNVWNYSTITTFYSNDSWGFRGLFLCFPIITHSRGGTRKWRRTTNLGCGEFSDLWYGSSPWKRCNFSSLMLQISVQFCGFWFCWWHWSDYCWQHD